MLVLHVPNHLKLLLHMAPTKHGPHDGVIVCICCITKICCEHGGGKLLEQGAPFLACVLSPPQSGECERWQPSFRTLRLQIAEELVKEYHEQQWSHSIAHYNPQWGLQCKGGVSLAQSVDHVFVASLHKKVCALLVQPLAQSVHQQVPVQAVKGLLKVEGGKQGANLGLMEPLLNIPYTCQGIDHAPPGDETKVVWQQRLEQRALNFTQCAR
jgi:hypothetical protein